MIVISPTPTIFGSNKYPEILACPHKNAKIAKVAVENIAGIVASPSNPSVKFTALLAPVNNKVQKNTAKKPISKSGYL